MLMFIVGFVCGCLVMWMRNRLIFKRDRAEYINNRTEWIDETGRSR